MEIIEWLNNWFASHCNEEWEHENQIIIETLDNPGWDVTIDLKDTNIEEVNLEFGEILNDSNDWLYYRIKNSKFEGSGDITKLSTILEAFKNIVTQYS